MIARLLSLLSDIRVGLNYLTALLLFPVVLFLAALKMATHEEQTWKDAVSMSFKDCMDGRWQDGLFVLAISIIFSVPVCLLLTWAGVSESLLSTLGMAIVLFVIFVIYRKKWKQDPSEEYDLFKSWPIWKQVLCVVLGLFLCFAAFSLLYCFDCLI